jgi:glycosyltransferase involved in cell wall biosynthesis
MKLNVCYLVDAPFLGGAERYVSKIATGLDKARFRPSVIMRGPVHPSSGLDQWRSELVDAGVPVRVESMDIPFRPWRAVPVFRAVADASPHVVHVNMPGPMDGQMGLLVPIARMAGARSVVVTEHLPMLDNTWKRGLLKRFSYRWVDRVATVCRANIPFLVEKQFVAPARTAVIHNAIDAAYGTRVGEDAAQVREAFRLPSDKVLVIFLGNLLKHKGLQRVVRALSEVPDLGWHLAVVGEGPERAPCEKRLEHRGLGDRASFLGRLSPGDVERVLGAADVLTLPSTIEGMPYVILEAMASGVPVVSTSVFGIPEMVVDGETGLLVDPGDDDGLREALAELVSDAGRRESLGSAARRRFERHFTLDRQIAEMESLYTKAAWL